VPSVDERRMAVRQLETIARSILALGQQYQLGRPRKEDEYIDEIVQAQTDPRSALDIMRMIAGVLARGKREYLDIASKAPRQALSVRSVDSWMNEIDQTGKLLEAMVEGLVESDERFSAAELREELRSIWESLDDESQHMLRRVLAFELQWLVYLIVRIEQTGDAKAFEDSGLLKRLQARKHKPRNVLEFLRLAQVFYGGRG
jgi:Cdc6-like AAA superfamily ATPase